MAKRARTKSGRFKKKSRRRNPGTLALTNKRRKRPRRAASGYRRRRRNPAGIMSGVRKLTAGVDPVRVLSMSAGFGVNMILPNHPQVPAWFKEKPLRRYVLLFGIPVLAMRFSRNRYVQDAAMGGLVAAGVQLLDQYAFKGKITQAMTGAMTPGEVSAYDTIGQGYDVSAYDEIGESESDQIMDELRGVGDDEESEIESEIGDVDEPTPDEIEAALGEEEEDDLDAELEAMSGLGQEEDEEEELVEVF